MSSQLSATLGTAFKMIFEEQGQICIQFAIDVGSKQISFADLFLILRHLLNAGYSFFHKLLSHHLAGTKQAILNRAERQARYFNNLFVTEIL